ncbi:ABC transporter substrate-binding protein [Arenibaculum pallidiluteum]|uniref:ABC transporter substrate-binding protein n=1 Tax=Arenibaculum pallidiluteum TaxID=2812559 RepID=UPI001A97AF9D|nr:ABC transporter substrate-binding protein [Arenibaculum pallidiluteum]
MKPIRRRDALKLPAGLLAGAAFAWSAHAAPVAFTDDAGRQVRIPAAPQRIYAAGHPASILLYVLAPDRLLGWTRRPGAQAAAFMPERYAGLPELGRLTGRGDTANVETVLAAAPDLILDYGTIAPTYVSLADRVQQQTGLPVALFDGRFETIPATLRRLGSILGVEDRAGRLAAYAERVVTEAGATAAAVPEAARPRVYYARGADGLETGLDGSINVELLEVAGARNVAAAAGRGGIAAVSFEQILSWDPDIVLTIDRAFFGSVRSDPRWAGLRAVREGRVYRSPDLPFGWFDQPPSVNRLIGVRWLQRVLYPGAAPGDVRRDAAEFHALFYHQEPSAAQLDRLLEGAGA